MNAASRSPLRGVVSAALRLVRFCPVSPASKTFFNSLLGGVSATAPRLWLPASPYLLNPFSRARVQNVQPFAAIAPAFAAFRLSIAIGVLRRDQSAGSRLGRRKAPVGRVTWMLLVNAGCLHGRR